MQNGIELFDNSRGNTDYETAVVPGMKARRGSEAKRGSWVLQVRRAPTGGPPPTSVQAVRNGGESRFQRPETPSRLTARNYDYREPTELSFRSRGARASSKVGPSDVPWPFNYRFESTPSAAPREQDSRAPRGANRAGYYVFGGNSGNKGWSGIMAIRIFTGRVH